ncbi:ABC transporter substrate-binding protein [Microcoleus sp. FACHB-1515]|uniref:ABC transporter substrate-binding protein n=1 Tax=Cyanophyceae TaxID=3028117 RepID=UPI001686FBFF|nr:ABC transporter substrate-binding protein [Microcoleus sp. FACHB-1515]MBD2089742.1 ABC transporter substrate-binding protein [Microcoleus sp. FACHB-1515]
MKLRRWPLLGAVFLLSLFVSVGCAQTAPTGGAASVGGAPISIGFSAWPGWFPWQVATEEGLFAKNNVNVEMKWFDGYLDSINALTARQLDGNSQTLNDTLSSISAGADLVVVLTNDNSTGNDKIIAAEEINSVEDLWGKKVAAEEGTVDHFLLLLGLEKAGMTQADIEFQPLETGAAAAAFVAGQVDAVGVFAPFTTKALERPGSKELFSSKDFPGAISDHLVVQRKLVDERPDDVQAIVNTWFNTIDHIEENRDRSLEIMAKRAAVSVEDYKEYEAGTKIFHIEENLKAMQPGNDMTSLQYAASSISDFLVEAGLAQQPPDYSRLFDDRFIKAYAAANPA